MPGKTPTKSRRQTAREQLQETMTREICEIINRTGLPPVEVLRLAAQAIGSFYREAARMHSDPTACECGWRPQHPLDMDKMSAALRSACRDDAENDLESMPVLGRA